jgi:dipeptidyl aminopeptidase/acylaminoacyl peptidase
LEQSYYISIQKSTEFLYSFLFKFASLYRWLYNTILEVVMKKATRCVLIALVFSALFTLLSAAGPTGTDSSVKNKSKWQWNIDDLITRDSVREYQLSPDGKKLIWTVQKWNLKTHKTYNILYLTRLDTKKRIRLTRGEDSFTSIQWVPGENMISFKTSRKFKDTKPGNLWLMDLDGGEPYPVTSFDSGILSYRWLDKDNFLFTGSEAKSLYHSRIKKNKDTSVVVEDEDHLSITRLFRFNLKTKVNRRLTDNVKPLGSFFLSHNKQYVVYSISMSVLFGQNSEIPPKYFFLDLKNLEAGSKEIKKAPKAASFSYVAWAKDNSGFYVSAPYCTHPIYTMASVNKVYWYSLSTMKYKEVDLQWDRYGSGIYPTDDGFIMSLLNGVHFKYARFFKKGNSWKRKWIQGNIQQNISRLQLAENGKTILYNYSTAATLPGYFLGELKGDRFIKKFEIMAIDSPLKSRPLGKREILSWKGAKDEDVQGILHYPVNYKEGKKYPLIVMIHGGPYAADMDFFSAGAMRGMHLWNERGAFVFRVNYHGSSNYGLAFGESIAGHYYEYEVPDIEKGVDLLIAQGKVDKDRLGVMGWSNGSILGIGLIINSNRYKVASLGAGDVNWTSDYGNCAFGVSFDNYYFGGPPWEKLDHYIEKSPLFKLHKVTTPTLIFHGSEDRAVPYSQGWEFYRALQVIGKAPVRFISFPGEGHGPRKLGHIRRKVEEEIRWFEKYLFKTLEEKNESLKKNSPLDKLDSRLKIARVNGLYGIEKDGKLIPEIVEYSKKKIGRFEVTRGQWAAFDASFKYEPGTGNYPVTGISFDSAKKYILWLNGICGKTFRLPGKDEVKVFYSSRSGNVFDYWAGYTLNPDDYKNLLKTLEKYGNKPVLIKAAGCFSAMGEDPVFDLEGNAAEWVTMEDGKGKACGGSADRPKDKRSDISPRSEYTGFRVVLEDTVKDTKKKNIKK